MEGAEFRKTQERRLKIEENKEQERRTRIFSKRVEWDGWESILEIWKGKGERGS